jgi:ABC-2 type transport system permease protein
MLDERNLWRERFSHTVKELGRYLRYIFNGHLVVVFIFLLGAAAFYYQEFIKTLGPDFPAALIMAVAIGFVVTYSPIYTFLLEADSVFLLPMETRLGGYFKKSLAVSYFVQIYLLLLALALFMPMYVQVYKGSFRSFFAFLLAIAVMKGWNLLLRWQIQFVAKGSIHLIDTFVRYLLNVLFLFFLFTNEFFTMMIAMLIVIILFMYWRKKTAQNGLKWEYLIDLEEKRLAAFYRLANLFTDVPKLKDRVKRRKWLDWLTGLIGWRQENTYLFLYLRTFLRAGDYFGLAVRLTVIGAGALYLLSFGYGQILLVLVFLYLTGFQLLPLARHHQYKILNSLYPVEEKWREKAFQQLLFMIMTAESILLALVLLLKGEWVAGVGSLVCALVFSYFFAFSYSKKHLKRAG